MVNAEDIYKYLGLAVVIILVFVFVSKCMRVQFKVMENFISRSSSKDDSDDDDSSGSSDSSPVSNLAQQVLDKSQSLEDALLIDKYKDDYEDLIINTEAMASMGQLAMLKQLAPSMGSSKSDDLINKINNLQTFKTALDNMMKDLDKKPSVGRGSGGGFF